MRKAILVSLVGLAVGAGVLATALALGPASAPSTQPAVRAPKPKKYPPAALVRNCRAEAVRLRKRLDGTFRIVVEPPFIIAGNSPLPRVQSYAKWSVVRPAKALWASYFDKKPDKVITVLLFSDDRSYRSWARKLFGDADLPHFGYYKPTQRTLVMNISTGTGTLVHELTHALIVYDFPGVPTWFNEGLASLHEQCSVGEKKIVGLVNWRLPGLKKAIARRTLRPLRELVTAGDFYKNQVGRNYAQARYFCMYMQEKELLGRFYLHLRKHPRGAGAGVKAIERIFGKGIDQVERDYLRWVATLKVQ